MSQFATDGDVEFDRIYHFISIHAAQRAERGVCAVVGDMLICHFPEDKIQPEHAHLNK